jgi:hypothetical protein
VSPVAESSPATSTLAVAADFFVVVFFAVVLFEVVFFAGAFFAGAFFVVRLPVAFATAGAAFSAEVLDSGFAEPSA